MSFAVNNQRIQVWGVVNATPNSFSDGGETLSRVDFAARVLAWRGCDGLDIGAESTAPMNEAISSEEERARLSATLVPLLKEWSRDQVLSLDTYHIETISWLLPQIPSDVSVVWNDVSGIVSDEVISLLKAYPQLRYVLFFSRVPERKLAGKHMQYVVEDSIVAAARDFFRTNFAILMRHNLFSQVIADPGFGFAKSRSQNHELLAALPALMDELACPVWMWGISRKSFLRFPASLDPKDPAVRASLDGLGLLWQSMALDKLQQPHTIIIRTHAPELTSSLESWSQLRETWKPNSKV